MLSAAEWLEPLGKTIHANWRYALRWSYLNTIPSNQSTGHHDPHRLNPRAVISLAVASLKVQFVSLTNRLLLVVVPHSWSGLIILFFIKSGSVLLDCCQSDCDDVQVIVGLLIVGLLYIPLL